MTLSGVPNPRTPLLDRLGGLCSKEWFRFFSVLFASSPSGYRPVASGVATLVGGTVTISNSFALAANPVHLTRQTPGGTVGHLSVPTASIVEGKTFVINSDSATEASTVLWTIYAPII